MTRYLPLLALLALLCACSFTREQQGAPAIAPSPTTVRVIQVTPVPTVDRGLRSVQLATPDPNATAAPLATDETSLTLLSPADLTACDVTNTQVAAHTVSVDLTYRDQTAAIQHRLIYTNKATIALDTLVFYVEPNRLPSAFTLDALTVDGAPPPSFDLTGRRLTVTLAAPLAPRCAAVVELAYTLQIPQIGAGLDGFTGYFGFGARQINLGHWLVFPAPRLSGAWIVHEQPAVGEQTIAEPADWDVTLNVAGASEALTLAAPGTVTRQDGDTWHIVHASARDFTISLSEQFSVMTATTDSGVVVELYHYDDAIQNGIDGATHALDVARHSLDMYADLFGAYPDPRMVVVQGDFPDGMEFDGIVFVSTNWFRSYAGEPTSYLTIITAHEIAHQWWYGRVGSDQAVTPWLDEALATYSEYMFYEEFYPELRDWWWETRINTFIPPDFADRTVDATVYDFETVRQYINAVYLRGARMMHALRTDVGTNVFFDWLHAYAQSEDGRIATADDFFALLTPEQLAQTAETRARFLAPPPEAATAPATAETTAPP